MTMSGQPQLREDFNSRHVLNLSQNAAILTQISYGNQVTFERK